MIWRRLFRLPAWQTTVSSATSTTTRVPPRDARGEVAPPRHGAGDAEAEAPARFGDAERVRDECITIDSHYAREVRFMEWLDSVRRISGLRSARFAACRHSPS